MDRNYIQDHQVIERYRQGRLPEAELEAFEVYLIDHPDLAIELEADDRLTAGLADLDTGGELEQFRGARERTGWLSSPQYAAAASVLLAVSLMFSGWLYQDKQRLEEIVAGGPAQTRVFGLDMVRAADTYPPLPAPPADEWIVLLLPLNGDQLDYDIYGASLREVDGDTVSWQADGLRPDFQESLSLGLPGRVLQPGEYEIRVTARLADWPESRESIEVSRGKLPVIAGD